LKVRLRIGEATEILIDGAAIVEHREQQSRIAAIHVLRLAEIA